MGAPRIRCAPVRYTGDTVEIPLPSGHVATVDAIDWPLISAHRWRARKSPWTVYTAAHVYVNGKRTEVSMHRLIMEATPGVEVDHIDHNGLNNRRVNLRLATPLQNRGNSLIQPNNKSGYKGVGWHNHTKKWRAYIAPNKHIGLFSDPWEAAQAYNIAASARWGEFALLNERKRD